MKSAYRISVGKPERNRPLRRLSHTWEDNIKIDLTETGCDDVDCSEYGPVAGNEISGPIKGEELID
jgi:hypothetical protein